ncbi:MAG: hypothetical protein LBG11_01520 [Bifidobacteriaceae bacterium]|nr:hypothetical protein [Bifidobacteriaceae bacterium]
MVKSTTLGWKLAFMGALGSLLGGLFAGCGVRPAGVAGESLKFEVVYSRLGWDEGPRQAKLPESFGAWVIGADEELAAYRIDQVDPGCLEPLKDVDLGEPPRIPSGATALLIAPGGMFDGQCYRVTGVYNDSGDWIVAAGLREKPNLGGSALNVGSQMAGIMLVEAPAPTRVVMRVEDQTGGPNDGRVWWSDGRVGE